MSDAELLALLRPHVQRIVDALRARATATFSADTPQPRRIGQEFSADAVERYASYFAADEKGQYPGCLHARFGVSKQTFADRTGLVRRLTRLSEGKPVWHWVKKDEPSGVLQGANTFSAGHTLAGDPEHFGVDDDGAEWMSEEAYATFAGDRSHLVKKEITNKKGKKQTVWVRPNTAAGSEQQGGAGRHGPDHVVSRALANPAALSAADLDALTAHLRGLPKEEIRQLNLAFRQKIGGTKTALADRLLAHLRAQQGTGPSPSPSPSPPTPVPPPPPAPSPPVPPPPAPPPPVPPPPPAPARTILPPGMNAGLVSQLTRDQLTEVAAGRLAPERVRDQLAGRLAVVGSLSEIASAYGLRDSTFGTLSRRGQAALLASLIVSHAYGQSVPVGPFPAKSTPSTSVTPSSPAARPSRAPTPPVNVSHTFTEPSGMPKPTDPPRVPQNIRFTSGESQSKETLRNFFGREVDPSLFAACVNAHDGAEVQITGGPDGIQVWTTGQGYRASRTISRDRTTGEAFIHNNHFRVEFDRNASPPPEWVQSNKDVSGSALLANQIRAARAMGIGYLETHAARSDSDDPNYGMNGYYTWPRLGYDDSIGSREWAQLQRERPDLAQLVTSNPTGSTTPNSILNLMTTEEGRRWWQMHGADLYDMKFDLKAGSLSMRTAEAYANERAAAGGGRTTPPPQSTPAPRRR